MRSSWQWETGHVACRWSELGQRVQYTPGWVPEDAHMQGAYLPPVPDFASHSPFGGVSWFQLHLADRDPE